MDKILLGGLILNISTILFLYLIIISVFNINYLKLKNKKSGTYSVYAILFITTGLLFYLILFIIKELGKYDSVQVHLAYWLRIVENLPFVLLALIIFLVINIYGYRTGKEKINNRIITSILIIMTIFVVYYWPHRNIMNTSADKLRVYTYKRGQGSKTIDNKDEVERLLTVINKYTFTRTTIKSIKGLKYNNIYMDIQGDVKGKLYVFKVIKYDNNETILEINYNLYKVNNQEKFDQEIFGFADRLE